MRDSTVVKLRAFLNLKDAHKGDGSKEAKYRNKLQKKKHCKQTNRQARRDRSEPARDSGAKAELICTTQKTIKHTNAPSVPKEKRDSREIIAAEQLMNKTKEEECCRDGRIYHNLVLLSSWWSAATHDLPCKRASQGARSPDCRGDSYLPS
jgi:hypothetical protein